VCVDNNAVFGDGVRIGHGIAIVNAGVGRLTASGKQQGHKGGTK
jgi:hypothetical protein